jgi:rod shape-determining protein MreD
VKRGIALVLVGLFLLVLQGALATNLPVRFTPDWGFLLVVAVAPRLRSTAGGVALAAWVGITTDVLSGSLLGAHALLRMGAFGAARFAGGRLNLRGLLPQATFVAMLSVADALGLWALASFFSPVAAPGLTVLREVAPKALVQAVFAPLVSFAVDRLLNRLGDDEGGPKLMRLATRGFSP